MNRMVTYRELLELKEWMVQTFVTREDFARLEGRVVRLELASSELRKEVFELRTEFREFKEVVTTRFDKVFDWLEKLSQERAVIHTHLSRLEEDLAGVKEELLGVKEDLIGVKAEQARMGQELVSQRAILLRIEEKLNKAS